MDPRLAHRVCHPDPRTRGCVEGFNSSAGFEHCSAGPRSSRRWERDCRSQPLAHLQAMEQRPVPGDANRTITITITIDLIVPTIYLYAWRLAEYLRQIYTHIHIIKQLGPGYDGVGGRAPIEGPVVFFVESCRPLIGAQLTIVHGSRCFSRSPKTPVSCPGSSRTALPNCLAKINRPAALKRRLFKTNRPLLLSPTAEISGIQL